MWINDEGVYTSEVNQAATVVAHAIRGTFHQPYFGPVVFTGGPDEEGETLPISEEQATRVRAFSAAFRN